MLWSGLSWVGASQRDNLIVPFTVAQNCPTKMTMNQQKSHISFSPFSAIIIIIIIVEKEEIS